MAEFMISSPSDKRDSSTVCLGNPDICIFCQKTFSKRNPPIDPDISRLDSLFKACSQRQDTVGRLLIVNKNDILNKTQTFKYHRGCRSTYCSQHHIKRKVELDEGSDSKRRAKTEETNLTSSSRLARPVFDWKNNCFLCGSRRFENHRHSSGKGNWSLVSTLVDESSQNIYTQVLNAAEKLGDDEMRQRLLGVGPDLVAADARYHQKKGCLAKYLSKANMHVSNVPSRAIQEEIVDKLMEEFHDQIMVGKEVYLLSFLRDRYEELSTETASPYLSHQLKQSLMTKWPELSFISQLGMSDFVCSSEISVGDALCKIKVLTKCLNAATDSVPQTVTQPKSEESIVHEAVGILRGRMKQTKKPDEVYYSSEEMTQQKLKDYVDPLLHKALIWLTNERLFLSAADADSGVVSSKCLNIACDIISLSTSSISPKHLGLSLHLQHEHGSRKLIEDMYNLGYGISYTELRRFLTSAAVYTSSCELTQESGTFIPPELTPKEKGGKQVIAWSDNWDHNESTVDGRKTTHAMTSILLTPEIKKVEFPKIPRLPERTLDPTKVSGSDLAEVLTYKKPTQRPEPIINPAPTAEEILPLREDSQVKAARLDEVVYNLARSSHIPHQQQENAELCPPWVPFHIAVSPCTPTEIATVAYTPILMAPPTDLSTVYTTLKRNKDIANTLGHTHCPVFFDMGLLTKALEVVWSRPDELDGVIPLEGGMHLLMSVMAGIGHAYGDAGISNLLHESGVFAQGTVQQIISGKHFSQGLYAIKLVDEVLQSQFMKNFTLWCEENGHSIPSHVLGCLQELNTLLEKTDHVPQDFMDEIRETVENKLLPLINKFREEGRQTSPTFKLWDEFLERVTTPFKMFIAASRMGNWKVCQEAKAEFLPLLFATNRSVYAKYMPLMLLAEKRLPPQITEHFEKEGQFVSSLTNGHFNKVWPDYVLESTENKALKGVGGIIGLTLRGPALRRWFLARPVTARFSANFQTNICHQEKESSCQSHHSHKTSAAKRWNSDVQKMTQMFDEMYVDPFNLQEAPPKLVNFATGVVASSDVEDSLLGALTKGEALAGQFVKERLIPGMEETGPKKSFYHTMPRSGIKTFSQMSKAVKVNKCQVQMNADTMYLRLLAINSRKQVPLKRVMAFENAPVPLSMFSEDGLMRTGTKSQLMHKLEELLPGGRITSVSETDAIIFDGHAVIQMLSLPQTMGKVCFKDMAAMFLDYILVASRNAEQIHVVFDQYTEESVKAQTRQKRCKGARVNVIHVLPDASVPRKWTLFLTRSENKADLARYYTEFMLKNAGNSLKENQTLYVSGAMSTKAFRVSKDAAAEEVNCLNSNHEEADTRIVLHAIYAADSGAESIVVSSPDTDVLILLIHHRSAIDARQIFFLTRHEGRHTSLRRYIAVHHVCEHLSSNQHSILLSVHCLTGCDTTSAFYAHGKQSAFKLLTQKSERFQSLAGLGKSTHVSDEQKLACIRFVSCLYGSQRDSLNSLRCTKASENVMGKRLPPTDDSFHLHILRSAFQLMIWHQATQAIQQLPDPTHYGYTQNENNHLLPKLMDQAASAPELLNFLVCSCKDCSEKCTCIENRQPCTQACACKGDLSEDCCTQDTGNPNHCTNPFTSDIHCDSDAED